MTTTAQDIIDRARRQLTDENEPLRWDDEEILWWISDGQRQAATIRPDLFSKVAVVRLASGTRQTLPADGVTLLGLIRNMGNAGTTPRKAITVVKRSLLDSFNPLWHSATRQLDVANYTYDVLDAKAYYVSPPSNGVGYVEINYLYTPAVVDDPADVLEIPDAYTPALFDYLMFRAHQKDAESAAGQATSDMYLKTFTLAMGQSLTAKSETDPNSQMSGTAAQPKSG